jgi:hypothetical protein
MSTDNYDSSKVRMVEQVRLLNECEAGNLENLECPTCELLTVSVWFTNPAVGFYRTWFTCTECGFHTRVQNSSKPLHYSEERRRTDLEERDSQILSNAVFESPQT